VFDTEIRLKYSQACCTVKFYFITIHG